MLLRSILAVVLFTFAFPAISNAQYRFERYQPLLQRSNRILGAWHGHGRHWRTPGHDSSYYNPWSAHNSALVTQGYPIDANVGPQYYHPAPVQAFPNQPIAPQPPTTPLGGSYSPFSDEDVDEKVPEIDPVEGESLPRLDNLPPTQGNQSQLNFSNEIYLHSTQRGNAQSTKAASIIEWTEIK